MKQAVQTALDVGDLSAALLLCEERLRVVPEDVAAHRYASLIHAVRGERMLAFRAAKRARDLAPQDARNWSELGRVQALFNEFVPAVGCFEQAVQLDPQHADGWHNLGTALKQLGERAGAFAALKKALLLDPTRAETYLNLGNLLITAGQYDDAVECFERAANFDPTMARARSRLAQEMSSRGKVKRAESLFRQSLGLNPDHVEAWFGLGRTLEDLGEAESALGCYINVLRRRPGHALALGHYLGLVKSEAEAELLANARAAMGLLAAGGLVSSAKIERMREDAGSDRPLPFDRLRAGSDPLPEGEGISEALSGSEGIPGSLPERKGISGLACEQSEVPGKVGDAVQAEAAQALIGYGLAKYHDRRGEFFDAAQAGLAANAARRRKAGPLDRAALSRRIDQVIDMYTPEFFAARRRYGAGTDQPVFIVGLPRSGTTLTEQILSAHPLLHGAGELPDLARLALRALDGQEGDPWQAAALLKDEMHSRELAGLYLTALRDGAPKGRLAISDKTPLNFFQLAFAAVLFPEARVIHCRRDARDNALSIWMENFNAEQRYATDFDDLAFFTAQYRRLMAHWRRALPLNMLEVQYEDTVADVKAQARRLLDFLKVPWDARCLDFHQSGRAVQTPSRWQVRQPIYTRSVARWRNYTPHLPELETAFREMDEVF